MWYVVNFLHVQNVLVIIMHSWTLPLLKASVEIRVHPKVWLVITLSQLFSILIVDYNNNLLL